MLFALAAVDTVRGIDINGVIILLRFLAGDFGAHILIIYGKHTADFNALWAVGAIIASCARDCFSVVYNSCNFFADGILMFIKFSKTRKRAQIIG